MQNFKRAIACIFIFIGGFGLPTAALSLFSPFGTKVYDAGDPLGSPVTYTEGLLVMGIYLVLLIIGIWLAVTGRRKSDNG